MLKIFTLFSLIWMAFCCTPFVQTDDTTYDCKKLGQCTAQGYGCYDCNPGTYSDVLDLCCGDNGDFDCYPCQPGTYSGSGAFTCTDCPAGTYSSSGSATSCNDCSSGYYSDRGATSCTSCPAGTYSGTSGAGSCNSCTAGHYSDGGASSCTLCAAGSYSGIRASSCTTCPAGTYSDSGAGSCGNCPAGTFSSSGASLCTPCSAGSTSAQGAANCSLCNAGYFSDSSGASTCSPCAAGYYSDHAGAPSCSLCQIGSYSVLASTSCVQCPAGTFSSITGASSCSPCTGGTYSSSGASLCSSCPAGYYSSPSASNCTVCPQGSHSIQGSSYCGNCPAGTYTDQYSSSCISCTQGTYSTASGSTSCSLCPPGTYSNVYNSSSYSCKSCPVNTYSSHSGSTACQSCSSGTYTSEEGSSQCLNILRSCDVSGQHSNVAVIIGFSLPFAAVGLFTYYIRSKSTEILSISLFSVVFQVLVIGIDLVTDILYLCILYSGALIPRGKLVTGLGAIFLISRFTHPFTAFWFLAVLAQALPKRYAGFFSKYVKTEYHDLIDKSNWIEYSKEWAVIVMLALLESQALKLLPWKENQFCVISGGYPDNFCFLLCSYSKLFQAMTGAIIQLAVFGIVNKNSLSTTSCALVVGLTISSTVFLILLTSLELVFRKFYVRNDNAIQKTEMSNVVTTNPMRISEVMSVSRIEDVKMAV